MDLRVGDLVLLGNEILLFSSIGGRRIMQYETQKRSILKTLSWRVWATITTAIIVLVLTGEFTLALTVGLVEVLATIGQNWISGNTFISSRFLLCLCITPKNVQLSNAMGC